MASVRIALTWLLLASLCRAQIPGSNHHPAQSALAQALGFEMQPSGNFPGGWNGAPPGTIFADAKVLHSGKWSARIERVSNSPNTFSTITKSIPIDFSGTRIELRGFLRTEGVSGFVGLWMREDGDSPSLAFENMQKRQLKGSSPWNQYSIQLPISADAKQLFFGVLMVGTGKAWADDLQLLVDGKAVWDLPRAEKSKTVLDLDHQFDRGSEIVIDKLTNTQIDNLVILGKIWGFLKYYHPTITSGQRHWDYELLRILPTILKAPDHPSANDAILHWIENLGTIQACHPCAELGGDLELRPDLAWISNEFALGTQLSHALRFIYVNRLRERQFYVSMQSAAGNPSFEHELAYANVNFPDSGFQLLALYRFWNIIEYWSPYRNMVGTDWTGVLAQFIPRLAMAKTPESYKRELLMLIAVVRDGHARLWNSLDVRPPAGNCQMPIRVRFIEDQPTITAIHGVFGEIKVGDVITALDGVPVSQLILNWLPYYSGSNESARLSDMSRSFTHGNCGESEISVRRDDRDIKLRITRQSIANVNFEKNTNDLPGPTFRLLSKDIAYLKLSSVSATECGDYIDASAGTKGIIIDIRNYPSDFVVFALGSLLVDHETAFARFTESDLSNPGAFHWTKPLSLTPQKPHYSGKVVILVDETSISQAEYTAMALASSPGAIVVGSNTAGADGNVSSFALPGALHTAISGIGVFYPDKGPTQRVGIRPTIKVVPTIAGVRDGRDEVLEEALRQVLDDRNLPLENRQNFLGLLPPAHTASGE